MKNFTRKRLSSMLAVLVAFWCVINSIPLFAYAQYVKGAEQAADGVSASSAEETKETAVITAPDQLALDGSKSYVIFTPCAWGGHTYGIGPDAAATEELGITQENCTPGTTVSLAQEGLGWTLNQTEDGLVIQNQGRYLTISENEAGGVHLLSVRQRP